MMSLFYRLTLLLTISVQVLFAVPPFQLQSVQNGYQFQLNLSDPELLKEAVNTVTNDGIKVNETFVKANVYGFEQDGTVGDPALPSSDIEFALENDVPQVEVSDVVTQKIQLEEKLYPVQPSQSYSSTEKPPFAYNPASYEPKKMLAKKNAASTIVTVSQVYSYRGQKSVTVTVKPMSYDVATNTITVVKQMTVNVKMDKPEVLHSWNSKAFDQVMRATYTNLGYAGSEPFVAKEKYLIITSPIYKENSALTKFVDFRSQRYDVKVVSTSDIGGTTIEAYRSFIRNEKPTFCLLVGNQFPSWNTNDWKSFNYYVATQVASASKKPMPDIALGLFYVKNADQITNIVNKTISTEENLATRPKVVLGQGGNNQAMDNMPKEHCDKIVEEVVSKYFLAKDGWTTHTYPTTTAPDAAKNAVAQFNSGCWFNVYNGHGLLNMQEYGWGTKDLSSMKNTVYPFVLNCCCETGTFDKDCFAAAAVGNTYGPVTMIASHSTSYYGQHVLCQGYPDGIIKKNITKSGLAFVYAANYDSVPKCYIGWAGIPSTWDKATMGWQYHHFGDPAIETMSNSPMISIVAPGKDDLIEQSVPCKIKWSSNIDGNVKIVLFKGAKVVSTLSAATAAVDGIYSWTPGQSESPGTDYQIAVTGVESPTAGDTSSTFSIIPEYLLDAPYFQSFDSLDSGTTLLPLKYTQSSDTSDVLDWLVWKGPTPSRAGGTTVTGPTDDKTSGKGNYLYIETSGNNSPNKKAEFTTPKFNLTNNSYQLSFWIHMYSSSNTMGTLSLDVYASGVWKNDALKITGNQSDSWVEQKLDLEAYKGERVIFRFRGVTGTSSASDICIDDFKISTNGTTSAPFTEASQHSYSLSLSGGRILLKIPKVSMAEPVKIVLYNSRGQFVCSLIDGKMSPGDHYLNLGNWARGSYIVTIKVGELRKTLNFIYTK